jgi:hypothetical protein
MKARMAVAGLGLALMVCGCSAPKAKTTGFLSDYSKLQKESDTSMRYVNTQAAPSYTGFIIDPVEVRLYSDEKAKGKITDEQLRDLTGYMHSKIREAIQDAGLKIAYQPAAGVARIRAALTNIEKTDAINILPQASLLGAGVGGASMEAEIVDSMTSQQIAAVLQSGKGSRVPFTNLGDWTAAKGVMDQWAKNFQKKLEDMHKK